EAAAGFADSALRANQRLHVIATSREALGVVGETILQVPPLQTPSADASLNDLLDHGAVKLFVSLASAAEPDFLADVRALPAAATICRRLDGIPLAIELAAPRVATLGVSELSARLDDRFRLLTAGNRAAMPRQQTLRAALDWSYDALSEAEQTVF